MDKQEIERLVTLSVIRHCTKENKHYIPVAVSNRHVHISAEGLAAMFGDGYTLKKQRSLSQPGQYACKEKVTLVGTKGRMEGLRILGPMRPETQVEITLTDTFKLGIRPVVRMSGSVKDTPGCKLVGPKGEYVLKEGVIVAKRHLHISPEQASWFELKNGDIVSARKMGERPVVFEDILVRAGDEHSLELHLDTDEANAAAIKNADLLELIK